MSKVRNSDIRSELRPSAQLLKLTYTASTEAAFEKFDRQCIKMTAALHMESLNRRACSWTCSAVTEAV